MGDEIIYRVGESVIHVDAPCGDDGSPLFIMKVQTAGRDSEGNHTLCEWWTTDGNYHVRWFRDHELVKFSG